MIGSVLRTARGAPAHRLPLRGADLVLMAMHGLWADAGVSQNTLLVVHLDGPVADGRIRLALDRFLDLCPWPAARLRRAFPWGKLHWAAAPRETLRPPPVQHRSAASPEALHAALVAELNRAIDPKREPPLRLLVIDEGPEPASARSVIVLTWFHPLMDPRGGQNLLGHLSRLDEGVHPEITGDGTPVFVAEPDARPLRERGRLARQSAEHMRALASVPPVSPGTGVSSPGRACFRQESFVETDPLGGDARARREISWRVALVGKALSGLWERRGLPDIPFLIPISVDLRRKGDPGPTFGNLLAFHFARFRPSETADVAGLARTLRSQMADAVRQGRVDANAVAMDFLGYRSLARMRRYLPGAAQGETFSFNCADIGDFPTTSLFGRRVVNAYHAPAVLPRPGLGVFFNRCAGRSNLVASWIEGAAGEDEATEILEVVREGMRWRRIA